MGHRQCDNTVDSWQIITAGRMNFCVRFFPKPAVFPCRAIDLDKSSPYENGRGEHSSLLPFVNKKYIPSFPRGFVSYLPISVSCDLLEIA